MVVARLIGAKASKYSAESQYDEDPDTSAMMKTQKMYPLTRSPPLPLAHLCSH